MEFMTHFANRQHRWKTLLALAMIVVMFSLIFAQAAFFRPVSAQSSTIDFSTEYSSGDVQVFPYLQAWYTWVNLNGTHMIFLALHSNQVQSPVSAFAGQGYNSSSGSRVFIANALLAMEVYNDTNHNGYLDANYAQGTTELKYTLIMNASQTFNTNAVQKTTTNNIPHYNWGVTYGTVQAILIRADPPGYGYTGGMAASYTNIDHVTISYDYSINKNVTYLKTSYDIGTVTLVPPTDPGVTLQGLSFSLLHTTLAVASHTLNVTAGGVPYDSQVNTDPSLVNVAQLSVDHTKTYEFLFKDNYTLETAPPVNYPAVYVAAPNASLPLGVFGGSNYTPLIRVQDYVRAQLPSIVGLPSTSDLTYANSSLIYRVSYPTWSAYGIKHDPTYVAHFAPSGASSQPPPSQPRHPTTPPESLPITILSAAVITGVVGLVVAVAALSRARKLQQPHETSDSEHKVQLA